MRTWRGREVGGGGTDGCFEMSLARCAVDRFSQTLYNNNFNTDNVIKQRGISPTCAFTADRKCATFSDLRTWPVDRTSFMTFILKSKQLRHWSE